MENQRASRGGLMVEVAGGTRLKRGWAAAPSDSAREMRGEPNPALRGVHATICTPSGTNQNHHKKQRLVTKEWFPSRVICATPLQKRPARPRSPQFLYCVC